jgi:hypothetical protein
VTGRAVGSVGADGWAVIAVGSVAGVGTLLAGCSCCFDDGGREGGASLLPC